MRARPRERPCPHGRKQSLIANTKEVRGLGPRTLRAKRRTYNPSESEAFARSQGTTRNLGFATTILAGSDHDICWAPVGRA